ncbi:Universal stress protein family protein [Minicystis rosea]|nr:Universal stress protein family protein [Minicystis rosea]
MSFTQKIVAPTDFSQASALAIDAAALLAKQFAAEIHLLYIYDPVLLSPLHLVPGAPSLSAPVQEPRAYEESVLRELQRVREERLQGIDKVELSVKQHTSAAEGIVEYARDAAADLIVLSTHGRTGLSHLLIGSVAERVVRHAPCPVLTMRSHAK